MKNFIQHCIAIILLVVLTYLSFTAVYNSCTVNHTYDRIERDTNALIKKSKRPQKQN